ncbi:MAG: CRISPR-associated helicase Cas3', partial [Bacteroidia bacterium]|nr:CRISPR-associated helicase Cas3' [Bacteroidia bacterium]
IENILNPQNGSGKASPGNANNPPSHQLQTTCPKWEIDYYDRLPDVCRHCVQIVYYSEEKLHQSASFVAKVEGIVNGEVKPPYPLDGRPVRILIVLNTVTQALQVYDVLKDRLNGKAEICLLHSLFTYNDRNKKEMDLKKAWGLGSETSERGPDRDNPQIVVATQVVEAALDIDADFLLTELAPADALVQRMGRVARRFRADDKGVKPPERPNVFIWARQQNSKSKLASGEGRVYDRELLELTLNRLIEGAKDSSEILVGCQENPEAFCLSEKRKKEWVGKVYEDLERLGKESAYLQDFYRTLEAVRAGFVAEHREEAQRVFRQLASVPAISEDCWKSCKQAIIKLDKDFEGKNFAQREVRREYLLSWQEQIVARFFVQVPFYIAKKHGKLITRKSKRIEEVPERATPRLEGVYVLEGYAYSFEKGLHPGAGASIQDLEEQIL